MVKNTTELSCLHFCTAAHPLQEQTPDQRDAAAGRARSFTNLVLLLKLLTTCKTPSAQSVFPACPLGIQDTLCWRRRIYSWIYIFLSSPASVYVTRRRHTHCSRRFKDAPGKLQICRGNVCFASSHLQTLTEQESTGGREGDKGCIEGRGREERERRRGGEIPAGQINNQADLRGLAGREAVHRAEQKLKCSQRLL